MKYVFFFIFLVLEWIFITPLYIFSILITVWYWDDEYIDIVDKVKNGLYQKLKDTLY